MNFLPGWMPAALKPVRFPVVEATNTSHTDASVTSHTVNLPSGIVAGNLLIVVFGNANAVGTSSVSGFTQLTTQTNASGRLTLFYKTATGSEGATVAGSTSVNTIAAQNAYRISGWTGTPEAVTTSGSDANPNPPNLTPSWGNTKTLWIAASVSDRAGATHAITVFPSGFSGGIQASGVVPVVLTSCTVGSAWIDVQAASEDPGTFTLNASVPWATATIGIRPI